MLCFDSFEFTGTVGRVPLKILVQNKTIILG